MWAAHLCMRSHCPLLCSCSIDQALLRGGLREGQLTEVCGESGERACFLESLRFSSAAGAT